MAMWNLTEGADRVLPGMHALDAPLSRFDVSSLITQLKEEEVWKVTRRNALTLVKDEALRAVLVVLSAGKSFAQHRAAGRVLMHVLEGRVRLSSGPSHATLAGGQMASLRPAVPHALEALEDSALLVVVTHYSASGPRGDRGPSEAEERAGRDPEANQQERQHGTRERPRKR